jgi:hypothetical protein
MRWHLACSTRLIVSVPCPLEFTKVISGGLIEHRPGKKQVVFHEMCGNGRSPTA